jgi:hypothetical protein
VQTGDPAFRVEFGGPAPAYKDSVLARAGPLGFRRPPVVAGGTGGRGTAPAPGPGRHPLHPDHGTHPPAWLISLDRPVSAPVFSRLLADGTLSLPRELTRRRQFSLESVLHPEVRPLTDWENVLGLSLPRQGDPRARALARSWLDSAVSEQIVQAALDLFRRNRSGTP